MIPPSCQVLHVGAMALIEGPASDIAYLKSTLTIQNRFTGEFIQLYRLSPTPTQLFVPRGIIEAPADPGPWLNADIQFKGELREKQIPIVERYLEWIKTHNGGIIKCPTGFGKTILCMSIMATLGLKTLIIVPYSHLLRQWIEGSDGTGGILKFTDIKREEIGLIQADKCDFEGKKVVMGMIHSLCKNGRYPKKMQEEFGLVCWDEVHRLSANSFSNTAGMFHCKYRLSLSATPRRSDGTEKVFLYHIGGICTPETKSEIIPSVVMALYPSQETSSDNCMVKDNFGKPSLDLGRYINKVARSKQRNKVLAGLIFKAYLKDRDILILSERLLQLVALRVLLRTLGVPEEDIGTFTGKEKSGLDRRILLATYGSAGTGADIPRLSCLVMATPRADVEQAVGRILRGASEEEPLVIDIVDEASPIMKGWASKRLKFYQSITPKITSWRVPINVSTQK